MSLIYQEQLCKSETALKHGINNTPEDARILANLAALEEHILEPVFKHFGSTPDITSGYRCPELNKIVGGEPDSQHCLGQAADFGILDTDIFEIASWIKETLEFDHLILEKYNPQDLNKGWVHVSYCRDTNRQQVQTFDGLDYYEGLLKLPLRG